MFEQTTVFVIVSDNNYYIRAKQTIKDLRTTGEWCGDIVYITIGFYIPNDFK